jgi:hypothetical protein
MSLQTSIDKVQKVFNKFICLRDQNEGCISCGSFKDPQAGHYFPVKTHTALRFNEINTNRQCSYCNKWQYGNQVMYRAGLVKKVGEDKVNLLEMIGTIRKPHKFSRFELEALYKFYSEKIKELKVA